MFDESLNRYIIPRALTNGKQVREEQILEKEKFKLQKKKKYFFNEANKDKSRPKEVTEDLDKGQGYLNYSRNTPKGVSQSRLFLKKKSSRAKNLKNEVQDKPDRVSTGMVTISKSKTQLRNITNHIPGNFVKDKIGADRHRSLNQTSSRMKNTSSNSVYVHLDPKRNFQFLKISKRNAKPRASNFETMKLSSLFEIMDFDSKRQNTAKKRKEKLKRIKPVRNYTIYNQKNNDEVRVSEIKDFNYRNLKNCLDNALTTRNPNEPVLVQNGLQLQNTSFSQLSQKKNYGLSTRNLNKKKRIKRGNSYKSLKSLKTRILTKLNKDNLRIKNKKLQKSFFKNIKQKRSLGASKHTQRDSEFFFGKLSLRRFLDETCEMQKSKISKRMLENELSRPDLRMTMRSYFKEKKSQILEKSKVDILDQKEGHFEGRDKSLELEIGSSRNIVDMQRKREFRSSFSERKMGKMGKWHKKGSRSITNREDFKTRKLFKINNF